MVTLLVLRDGSQLRDPPTSPGGGWQAQIDYILVAQALLLSSSKKAIKSNWRRIQYFGSEIGLASCISFKQFFLELYHGTTDNFRPGDGCHFQQYGGQHCSRNITNQVTQATSWPWQSRLRTSDSRLTNSPQKAKAKQTEASKTIRSRHRKPDEPNVNGPYKSWGNKLTTLRAPTAYSTDRNPIYGSTRNSRPPWTRSVTEPTRNY